MTITTTAVPHAENWYCARTTDHRGAPLIFWDSTRNGAFIQALNAIL